MKHFLFILLFLIFGCNDDPIGRHCYVVSGLYLVDGVQRPPVGYVGDVFDEYNTDPALRLIYLSGVPVSDIWRYQTNGSRVVVVYAIGGGMNHSRPMEYHEQLQFEPIGYYISFYVQE